jgi:hypothetical protein
MGPTRHVRSTDASGRAIFLFSRPLTIWRSPSRSSFALIPVSSIAYSIPINNISRYLPRSGSRCTSQKGPFRHLIAYLLFPPAPPPSTRLEGGKRGMEKERERERVRECSQECDQPPPAHASTVPGRSWGPVGSWRRRRRRRRMKALFLINRRRGGGGGGEVDSYSHSQS